jgi:membrane-associated phospholipid phosphatase
MAAQAYQAPLRARAHPQARSVAAPIVVAALCAGAMALVWVLAALVPATHYRDAVLLHDFTQLNGPAVRSAALPLYMLGPLGFVLWGAAVLAFALAQERTREAAALAAVMILAPLSADLLKPLTAHAHASVGGILPSAASWPSGHSTAVLAVVLCAVFIVPGRWKALVACVGAIYVLSVALVLLLFASHMPSDVIAGFLLASFWMALAVAGLRAAQRRWPVAG